MTLPDIIRMFLNLAFTSARNVSSPLQFTDPDYALRWIALKHQHSCVAHVVRCMLDQGRPCSGTAVQAPDDLAALWAQLQLKHTQEAAAASMSRRASAEHQLPGVSQHSTRSVEGQSRQAADVLGSQTSARLERGAQPGLAGPASSNSAPPKQGSSEEAFWKMMQQ